MGCHPIRGSFEPWVELGVDLILTGGAPTDSLDVVLRALDAAAPLITQFA